MELRLPTVAVPVRLAMIGASPVDAELFVADVPRPHRAKLIDDVAAMLDEPEWSSFAPGFALAGCWHEQQYSRLFRS